MGNIVSIESVSGNGIVGAILFSLHYTKYYFESAHACDDLNRMQGEPE